MTDGKTSEPHDTQICGASKRAGGQCGRPAGWGTDHPGSGRCKLHGGRSPIKHGRYSTITRPRIAELLKAQEKDPDPLNLLPEVQLLRSLIIDFVERYDEFTEALMAWHNSFTPEYQADAWKAWRETISSGELEEYPNPSEYGNKPRKMVDILSAGKFIGEIGGLVDKIQKQKQEGTITLDTLNRVMEQIGVEVVGAAQEAIADAAERSAFLTAFERRWSSVRLDPPKRGPQGA